AFIALPEETASGDGAALAGERAATVAGVRYPRVHAHHRQSHREVAVAKGLVVNADAFDRAAKAREALGRAAAVAARGVGDVEGDRGRRDREASIALDVDSSPRRDSTVAAPAAAATSGADRIVRDERAAHADVCAAIGDVDATSERLTRVASRTGAVRDH